VHDLDVAAVEVRLQDVVLSLLEQDRVVVGFRAGILKPCPSSWLETTEVSRSVNSVKNNSPELLLPVESSPEAKARVNTLFEL
jgi:hypothetical protein